MANVLIRLRKDIGIELLYDDRLIYSLSIGNALNKLQSLPFFAGLLYKILTSSLVRGQDCVPNTGDLSQEICFRGPPQSDLNNYSIQLSSDLPESIVAAIAQGLESRANNPCDAIAYASECGQLGEQLAGSIISLGNQVVAKVTSTCVPGQPTDAGVCVADWAAGFISAITTPPPPSSPPITSVVPSGTPNATWWSPIPSGTPLPTKTPSPDGSAGFDWVNLLMWGGGSFIVLFLLLASYLLVRRTINCCSNSPANLERGMGNMAAQPPRRPPLPHGGHRANYGSPAPLPSFVPGASNEVDGPVAERPAPQLAG